VIRLLLDSPAYSWFMRGAPKAVEALRNADTIVLTPVVLGELRAGFARGSRRERNEQELRTLMESPRVETVVIDDETADRYAIILEGLRRVGKPIPTNDVWIASSAMQHGLRVLTADENFLSVPQVVVELLR
jgi:predicted nucleic acid-binding protein